MQLACARGLPTPPTCPPFHDSRRRLIAGPAARNQHVSHDVIPAPAGSSVLESLLRWSPCFVRVPASLDSLSRWIPCFVRVPVSLESLFRWSAVPPLTHHTPRQCQRQETILGPTFVHPYPRPTSAYTPEPGSHPRPLSSDAIEATDPRASPWRWCAPGEAGGPIGERPLCSGRTVRPPPSFQLPFTVRQFQAPALVLRLITKWLVS